MSLETELTWAVDSASFAPGEKKPATLAELLVPVIGTRRMVERVHTFNTEVLKPAGIENATVSLLPSLGIDTLKAQQQLEQIGVPVSSYDIPYLVTGFVTETFKRGYWKTPDAFLQHVGFSLLNSPTTALWKRKVSETCDSPETAPGRLVLRTASDFWKSNSARGDHLLRIIKQKGINNALIVVEIDANEHDSFADYLGFLERLKQAHLKEVEFGISFDAAHVAQKLAQETHGHAKTIAPGAAEAAFETVLGEKLSPMLYMVEVDQIDSEGRTHLPINAGLIDFNNMFEAWGRTVRQSASSPKLSHAVIEHNPVDYNMVLTNKGQMISYLKSLDTAFRGN